MSYINRWAGIIMGLLLWAAMAPAQADASEGEAVGVVEALHSALLKIMQNGEQLGFKGRYDVMSPLVETSFDTPLIAQVVLSRYWKELDPEKQKQFVTLFNRLSASTYASRFNSFTEESFSTLGAERLKNDRILVKTELLKEKDETPVKLEYLLQQKDGKWYIISVIADGVNDLALKRAEYADIITKRGFDSLVGDIEKKISELETKI